MIYQDNYLPPWPDRPAASGAGGVLRPGQFSLANLFVEIFWIGAFLASVRLSAAVPLPYLGLALLLNLFTFSVAVGGAVGQMRLGAIVGLGSVGSLVQIWLALTWPYLLLRVMDVVAPLVPPSGQP